MGLDFPRNNLNQRITYWAPGAQDGFGGIAYSTLVVIKARWEDRIVQFVDNAGNEQLSRAVVYPDRDLSIGGWLFNGVSTATDPRTLSNAREIRTFRKTPNIDGDDFERRVFL